MSYIKHSTLMESVNDPRNVEVHTEDRYLTKQTARLISRKSLLNRVEKHCKYYQSGQCKACETDKEVHCITAWQLTIGRGKKLY
ncbi:hypothetical protein [Paenibacillus lactis]|uniref:hypothetical protein n=1 Tax=Paenibacillus lactis TaxID=228574 RepID=UPI003D7125FD